MLPPLPTSLLYGSAVSAPTARSQALCAIKSDFLNLIHQADVIVNGKSIEQCQPFINMCRHFQLISEMSANDVATLGHSIGFAPTLDNPKSAKYDKNYAATTSTASSGNGYSNNRIFGFTSDNQIAAGAQRLAALPIACFATIGNAANQYKISRYVDVNTVSGSGVYG